MDEMLNFRKNALLANLCKEWNGKWAACHNDKEKLMRLGLAQQAAPYFATFCYNGRGLSKDYCLREFGDYINKRVLCGCDDVNGGYKYMMHIEGQKNVFVSEDVAQFLWCDKTKLIFPSTHAATIYVSNRSDVHICCDGYNSLRIYLFDESKITIDKIDADSNILVYKYSDDAVVVSGAGCQCANIKQFSKPLKL